MVDLPFSGECRATEGQKLGTSFGVTEKKRHPFSFVASLGYEDVSRGRG
jgi:hypothetical protein